MVLKQNLINHVAFVLDASYSMQGKDQQLITVMDELVGFLKDKSESYSQETRVTIYTFGSSAEVVCYDLDVLRAPTIRGVYRANGRSTSLIDATLLAVNDLDRTATLYGSHAFLLYVLTDGQENSSRSSGEELRTRLSNLPNNWTVAALVPDKMGQRDIQRYGFHLENTVVWDATTGDGVEKVSNVIQDATAQYFDMRASGTVGTRGLFQASTEKLTPRSVDIALTPVSGYDTFSVVFDASIRDFVERATGRPYRTGSTYYQLTKTEEIQAGKQILLRDKVTGFVYGGQQARSLLGLPDYSLRVAPGHNPAYTIFVQSTSVNRKLLHGTEVIVLR